MSRMFSSWSRPLNASTSSHESTSASIHSNYTQSPKAQSHPAFQRGRSREESEGDSAGDGAGYERLQGDDGLPPKDISTLINGPLKNTMRQNHTGSDNMTSEASSNRKETRLANAMGSFGDSAKTRTPQEQQHAHSPSLHSHVTSRSSASNGTRTTLSSATNPTSVLTPNTDLGLDTPDMTIRGSARKGLSSQHYETPEGSGSSHDPEIDDHLNPALIARLAQAMGMISGSSPNWSSASSLRQVQHAHSRTGDSVSDEEESRVPGPSSQRQSSLSAEKSPSRSRFSESSKRSRTRIDEHRALVQVQPPDGLAELEQYATDAAHGTVKPRRQHSARLMTLKTDLTAMKKAIAKEWNLPSTGGMHIRLLSARGETTDQGSIVSSEAWRSLTSTSSSSGGPDLKSETLSSGLRPLLTSASSQGTQLADLITPPTLQTHFGSDIFRPITQSPSSYSITPSASVSQRGSPARPTQTSSDAQNRPDVTPIFQVSFEFDRATAKWFDLWLARKQDSRHRGLKPLKLGDLVHEETSAVDQVMRSAVTDDTDDELADLHAEREDRRSASKTGFNYLDIGSNTILQDRVQVEDLAPPSPVTVADDWEADDIDEIARLLAEREQEQANLASPLALASPNPDRERAAEKRGSGQVMKDRLDDLEKTLRALSPRDLRVSVYHRMSMKPVDPSNQDFAALSEDRTDVESNLLRSWPAVPFAKTPEATPLLPQDAARMASAAYGQKWTPRSMPSGSRPQPLSPETMMRMEYESDQWPFRSGGSSSGWRLPQQDQGRGLDFGESIDSRLHENGPQEEAQSQNLTSPGRTLSKDGEPKRSGSSVGEKVGRLFGGGTKRKNSKSGKNRSEKAPTSSPAPSNGSTKTLPLKRESTQEVIQSVQDAMATELPPLPARKASLGQFSSDRPPVNISSPPTSPGRSSSGNFGKMLKSTFAPFSGAHRRLSSGTNPTSPKNSSRQASQDPSRTTPPLPNPDPILVLPSAPVSPPAASSMHSSPEQVTQGGMSPNGGSRRKPVPAGRGGSSAPGEPSEVGFKLQEAPRRKMLKANRI